MNAVKSMRAVRTPIYRVSPSEYWAQHWNRWPPGVIATLQLVIVFGTLSMEIGNAVVDLFRSNVYSGFWSFPFMISATFATYACVYATRTQTKATVALALQILSIVVVLVIMGFSMAFIATSFTLCLGFQCSQNSSTTYSSSVYTTLKQAFISTELACSIVYITLSIMYIIIFVKCYRKLPRVHPLVVGVSRDNHMTVKRKASAASSTSNNQSLASAPTRMSVTFAFSYYRAQKVCPNCQHVSPYIPDDNIVQCPRCKYRSPFVEHAQQW